MRKKLVLCLALAIGNVSSFPIGGYIVSSKREKEVEEARRAAQMIAWQKALELEQRQVAEREARQPQQVPEAQCKGLRGLVKKLKNKIVHKR